MARYKIRKTGEIVDVISCTCGMRRNEYCIDKVSYIDSNGIEHVDEHMNLYWDFESIDHGLYREEIDWEERRYELAKYAMQGDCASSGLNGGNLETCKKIAIESLNVADAVIKQLKKE